VTAPAPAPLTFTGERFLPEIAGEIWHEHWHRYALAMPVARGRRVLDAACGEGYGSALLAGVAREVTGVDVAPDVVAHATRRYGGANLRFVAGSCAALPLPDAAFDLVVSFETIEHLAEQREMLAEFRRVLAPDGLLLLSSPNQPVYAALGPGRNEYHVRELTRDELADLLTPVFPAQHWYGQAIVARSALWREDGHHDVVELLELDGEGRPGVHRRPADPVYFVVLAAAAGVPLPTLPSFSLFGDDGASLLAHYRDAIRRAAQLYWDERNASKIAEERQHALVAAVNDLAHERQAVAPLRARVADLEARLARAEHDVGALTRHVAWRESFGGWWRWPIERWRAKRRGPASP
jgi:ubiquinone/menaquinone biosynthesis C-methylase UbiE